MSLFNPLHLYYTCIETCTYLQLYQIYTLVCIYIHIPNKRPSKGGMGPSGLIKVGEVFNLSGLVGGRQKCYLS